MAYRPKGRRVFVFKARTPTGWTQLSTGTTSKRGAEKVAGAWESLASEHFAWDVLELVLTKKRSIRAVMAAWESSGRVLGRTREILAGPRHDPDVAALVEPWSKRYSNDVKPDTAAHALAHVRWLLPEGLAVPASTINPSWLDAKLQQYEGKRNTRRKVHANWAVFFDYVTRVHKVFPKSPLEEVTRPRVEASPIMFYEQDEVEAIVEAQPTPERRAFMAVCYGTGCDVSAALRLRRSDIQDAQKQLRAPGTKAHNRDRECRIAEWAWPIIRAHIKDRLPTSLLFPEDWTRYKVSDWHRETVLALKAKNVVRDAYPLRNSRDHWAVRAVRAGTPTLVVAAQLGHGSPQLVLTKYGRFAPSGADRDRWEQKAVEYEEERRKARQA